MNEIQDGLKKIREYIAHMVLTMDGNIGVPPKCVVNPIQREWCSICQVGWNQNVIYIVDDGCYKYYLVEFICIICEAFYLLELVLKARSLWLFLEVTINKVFDILLNL